MIIGFYQLTRDARCATVGGTQHYLYGNRYFPAFVQPAVAQPLDIILGTGLSVAAQHPMAKLISLQRRWADSALVIIERLLYRTEDRHWLPFAVTYREPERQHRYVLPHNLSQIHNPLYARHAQLVAYTDPLLECLLCLNGRQSLAFEEHPLVGDLVPDTYAVHRVSTQLEQVVEHYLAADASAMQRFRRQRWREMTPVIDPLLLQQGTASCSLRHQPLTESAIRHRFADSCPFPIRWPDPLSVSEDTLFSPESMRDIADDLMRIMLTDFRITYRRKSGDLEPARHIVWEVDQYRHPNADDAIDLVEDLWAIDTVARYVASSHTAYPDRSGISAHFTITKTMNEEATIEIHPVDNQQVVLRTIHFDFARLSLGSYGVSAVML